MSEREDNEMNKPSKTINNFLFYLDKLYIGK